MNVLRGENVVVLGAAASGTDIAVELCSTANQVPRFSAQDPDPDLLDPQDFGFLDPDPQKYVDLRIRIQGAKYQPKTAVKNFLLSKPQI